MIKASKVLIASETDPELHVHGYAMVPKSAIEGRLREEVANLKKGAEELQKAADSGNWEDYQWIWDRVGHPFRAGIIKNFMETLLRYEKTGEIYAPTQQWGSTSSTTSSSGAITSK